MEKLSAEVTASCDCASRVCHSIYLKYCACHEKVLHLSHLKIWCSKIQPLSGNQRPDLLTSLMNMSLVLLLPRDMHLCRSFSNAPRLPSFLKLLQNPRVWQGADSPAPVTQNNDRTSKNVRACGAFSILTSKCASRHNSVHFLDISTTKSAPNRQLLTVLTLWNALRATTPWTFWTVCFAPFDFKMCFAPQQRALFRHPKLPKALWSWGVLCIFTRRCSSRHNAVHFLNISTSKNAPALKCVAHFYSHLTRWLRTCRFSEPTIRASWASKHWEKHSVARFFFSRTLSLFLLTVSLLALSLGSDSSHLCFSICPYCRKFDF